MSADEQIQSNCARFRKEAGLTQQAVAEETGLSIDIVRAWEQGRRTPERDSIVRLSRLYGRPFEHFLMAAPPPSRVQAKPEFEVRTKIVGNAPPGLEEALQETIRRFTPAYAHEQAKIKKQLHKKR